jgi:hypothetical protein
MVNASAGCRIGLSGQSKTKTPAESWRGFRFDERLALLPSLGVVPVVNVLSDLILGEAVAFLNLALKLISLTVDGRKVVVGEISPLLLDLSLHLLPVTLDAIPVHFELPL